MTWERLTGTSILHLFVGWTFLSRTCSREPKLVAATVAAAELRKGCPNAATAPLMVMTTTSGLGWDTVMLPPSVRAQSVRFGVTWSPYQHFRVRPELHCDWASGGMPFNDGTDNVQVTSAVDMIWSF